MRASDRTAIVEQKKGAPHQELENINEPDSDDRLTIDNNERGMALVLAKRGYPTERHMMLFFLR